LIQACTVLPFPVGCLQGLLLFLSSALRKLQLPVRAALGYGHSGVVLVEAIREAVRALLCSALLCSALLCHAVLCVLCQ